MYLVKLAILLLANVAWHCSAIEDASTLLEHEKNLKGNGVRTVLSFEGLERAAESIVNAIIPELPNLPSHPRSRNVIVGASSVTVDKMRVLAVSQPTAYHVALAENNALLISMKNFITSAECSLKRNLRGALGDGRAMFESKDMTLDVLIEVKKRDNGSPLLNLLKCSIVKGSSPVTVNVNGLPYDPTQQVQRALMRDGDELMEFVLCSHVEWAVNSGLNERFAKMPTSRSLADIARDNELRMAARKASRKAKNKAIKLRNALATALRRVHRSPESAIAVIDSFNLSRAGDLYLDFGMRSDPVSSEDGLEFMSSGEVSVGGKGDTPFGSVPLPVLERTNSTSMLRMVISDFLPNSLMYHGHRINLFNTRVDPTTPQLGPVMRTSCGADAGPLFCLGDLLPTLRHFHPNRGIAMDFGSAQPPVIIFKPDQTGAIFAMNGRLAIWAIDDNKVEKKVGDASIEIEAFIKFRVVGALLKAKLALEKIHMKSLNFEALDQDELDDASLLGHEIIQRIVNDVLKDGIPLPINPLFRMRRTKLTMMDRVCVLTADFQLDNKVLRKLTTLR